MQHAKARSHLSDARFPENVQRQGGASASVGSVNADATPDACASRTTLTLTYQAIPRSPLWVCHAN